MQILYRQIKIQVIANTGAIVIVYTDRAQQYKSYIYYFGVGEQKKQGKGIDN